MKLKLYYITIFIALFCVNTPLFAQLQKTEAFDINDFLGERTFKSATQSDDLILYFNTSKGILTFDGNDFNEIEIIDENLKINEIQFFQDELYIATENSLNQYFPTKDSLVEISNTKFQQLEEYNNQLWLISETELFVWENDQLKSVYKAENGEIFQCLEINNKNTLIGHDKGLTLLEKGEAIQTFGTFLNPKKFISFDSSTFILSGDAIFKLTKGKIVRDFKYDLIIKDFYIDDVSKIWFADKHNKIKINDLTNIKPLYYDGGTKLIEGQKLFPDKENNLWIMGKNNLLKITQNNPFSKLFEKNILGVFIGQNSNLILKPNEIINYSEISESKSIKIPKSEIPIQQYFAFEKNDEWFISLNNSIYSLSAKKDELVLLQKNSTYIPIKTINNEKYLAKNNSGELFFTDSNFDPIEKLDFIKPLTKTIIDFEKTYAFCKDNSLSVLDSDGNLEYKLSLTDTINLENIIPAKIGFWYYTAHNIYKINRKGLIDEVKFDVSINLKKEQILNLFDDKEGNLWLSTKNNLLRAPIINKNSILSLQKPVFYNKKDFLFSTYFKSAVKDDTGLVWFLNENGVSIYNPLKEIPNLVAPSIKIENAFAYKLDDFNNPTDTVFLLDGNKKISNNSIVVIEPKVINHFNTHKSTIGYRNLSFNQSERKIEIGEKIILTELSDGLNTISLKAYNSNGIESNNEANINIYVTPPIWKQNWFYATTLISLFLISFIGYRTVIGIKNSRARELEDELQKGLEDLEKKSHLQVLKAERLKQLNELITSQKGELEKKNKQIESQKYELSLTNQQIKKQKDLLEETSSKLGSSINYAKRIQSALMSTEVEIKKAFKESFVYFLPRDVVSGDFFWFNKATNEKGEELLILAAVDCTGHGVPGAIVSVVGMNLLNNITKLKKIYDPGQILTEMNQDIISDLRQDETQVNDGMDMTIVTFNTITKQLYFAGAKNPLMYIEDGELTRIKGDKHAIGGQQRGDERSFNTHQLDLSDNKKRTFYLFSDGYQDQFGGEKGFKYLVGNFKKLLISIHDKKVLEQKTILHEEIEEWKDGYAQTDDILVIGFKL